MSTGAERAEAVAWARGLASVLEGCPLRLRLITGDEELASYEQLGYDYGYPWVPGIPDTPPAPDPRDPDILKEALRLQQLLETERERTAELRRQVSANHDRAAQAVVFQAALQDVLSLFTSDAHGWVRCESVPVEDLNGWLKLARTGRVSAS